MEKKKPILEYYTDGACSGNPGPGGYAVIRMVKKQDSYDLEYWYQEENPYTTNNRMELMAVLKVLSMTEEKYHTIIYSDSAYVVNMCNDWIWKWASAGWTRAKNKPIENLDLVKKLYDRLNFSKEEIEIKKCSGHSGILENEVVDALASKNITKFEKLVKQYNIKY